MGGARLCAREGRDVITTVLPRRGHVYQIRQRSDNGIGSRSVVVERRRGDMVYVRDRPDEGRCCGDFTKVINVARLRKYWRYIASAPAKEPQ